MNSSELIRVRASLLAWYHDAHRDFPWRGTSDPYAVLVSEVMLQQTQASRVAERFPDFMDRYPTVEVLAGTTDAEVLTAWSGLGYNRRAVALRRAARSIVTDGWPDTLSALQRLSGVGPYTARAIASLAFGQPVGVVDTNVRRWLLRRFTVEDRPTTLQAVADILAAPGSDGTAAAWTHASMEFGAGICTSRTPSCSTCPVRHGCPSRDRAGRIRVPRQAAFAGSTRAARGRLLRALSEAPGHRMRLSAARHLLDDRLEPALGGLESDGLVHRSGKSLRLGGRPAGEPASVATIGP